MINKEIENYPLLLFYFLCWMMICGNGGEFADVFIRIEGISGLHGCLLAPN
jgi:hypothetical protein